MICIDFQNETGKYTLLGIDGKIPSKWNGNSVIIDGKKYSTEIVYDFPNHIAIIGSGDFVGKEVIFE